MKEIELSFDVSNLKPLLDISDIQDYLGIGKTKTYNMIALGEIRSIRVGKSIRIPRQYFMEYLKSLEN